MLSISPEQFKTLYAGTEIEHDQDTFYTTPTSDQDLLDRYLPSKLWRLNNIYTIIDKQGKRIIFKMNLAQHKVYAMSLKHPRLIILKSRQQGISTLWLVAFFDDCVFYSDFSSGLMAQGADEAETLLLRTKVLWDELDLAIKEFLNLEVKKNNTKEFSLTNGSSIFVRTSFRSTTLQRLHISEFGKIANRYPERARETKTGTLQAIAPGNTTIIESTAEGDNVYKQMWDTALAYAGDLTEKDFMPVFLSWVDDPDCTLPRYQEANAHDSKYFKHVEQELKFELSQEQKNFWVAQFRELGNDIYQEYPTTAEEAFLRNRDGTYYADLYLRLVRGRARERANLYDPNLPVQVAVDLGRNDFFVLIFFQAYTDGWRIINSYHNSGKGIKHYCEVMDNLKEQLGYDISRIVLPHDAEVRDLTSDMTREEAFWNFGYTNTDIVKRTKDINNDRELVRQALEEFYIDPQAQYIIDCLLNYTKEWDERREVWKDTHAHDKHSHGADAIRQMVRGGLAYTTQNQRKRNIANQINRGYGIDI
jgi:hypothetical protein